MWVNTTESPVCFRAVRGSTCSQVAGTVTSYHIAEQDQSPDESFYCCSSRKRYVKLDMGAFCSWSYLNRVIINLTPDRRQSRTIFYLQVNRSRLLNKACSIAKTTIAVRKLDVFDWTAMTSILAIENVLWTILNNLKRKILRSQLSPIRCEPGLEVTKRFHAQRS